MADFGQRSWERSNKGHIPNAQKAFDILLELSQAYFPSTSLFESCKNFESERGILKDAYKKVVDNISKEPFVTSFLVWVKESGYLRADMLLAARLLLENGFICDKDSEGESLTIGKARGLNHENVVDAIRSKRDWPIQRRESVVQTYLAFLFWLWEETHGYFNRIEDPDWLLAQKRKLIFPRFIEFLDAIPSEKTQLVAKLLYFGQNRNLDEILSLTISDIAYPKKAIAFVRELAALQPYPGHVFADLKAITQGRSNGPVFLGRQDAPLNDSTIFRHFNEAALKVGLGEKFGPKRLVANHDDPDS